MPTITPSREPHTAHREAKRGLLVGKAPTFSRQCDVYQLRADRGRGMA
jgi:hypothetical protein